MLYRFRNRNATQHKTVVECVVGKTYRTSFYRNIGNVRVRATNQPIVHIYGTHRYSPKVRALEGIRTDGSNRIGKINVEQCRTRLESIVANFFQAVTKTKVFQLRTSGALLDDKNPNPQLQLSCP